MRSERQSVWRTTALRRSAAFVVAALAAVCAAAAVAAPAASPPEGPMLETMPLAPTDFARGASVRTENFVATPAPFVIAYTRSFNAGAQMAGQRFLGAESNVALLAEAGLAPLVLNEERATFSSASGRAQVRKGIVAGITAATRSRVKVKSVVFGTVTSVQAGQGAFRTKVKVNTSLGSFEMIVSEVVVDRAVGVSLLTGYPRKHISSSVGATAAQKLAAHFRLAFTIRGITPPTINGAPVRGAALLANAGRWVGGPSSYAYQWNRCDAAGANCAPIAGAVAQAYIPGTTDAGARLTVTVTASNSVTSVSAASASTAPIA